MRARNSRINFAQGSFRAIGQCRLEVLHSDLAFLESNTSVKPSVISASRSPGGKMHLRDRECLVFEHPNRKIAIGVFAHIFTRFLIVQNRQMSGERKVQIAARPLT